MLQKLLRNVLLQTMNQGKKPPAARRSNATNPQGANGTTPRPAPRRVAPHAMPSGSSGSSGGSARASCGHPQSNPNCDVKCVSCADLDTRLLKIEDAILEIFESGSELFTNNCGRKKPDVTEVYLAGSYNHEMPVPDTSIVPFGYYGGNLTDVAGFAANFPDVCLGMSETCQFVVETDGVVAKASVFVKARKSDWMRLVNGINSTVRFKISVFANETSLTPYYTADLYAATDITLNTSLRVTIDSISFHIGNVVVLTAYAGNGLVVTDPFTVGFGVKLDIEESA